MTIPATAPPESFLLFLAGGATAEGGAPVVVDVLEEVVAVVADGAVSTRTAEIDWTSYPASESAEDKPPVTLATLVFAPAGATACKVTSKEFALFFDELSTQALTVNTKRSNPPPSLETMVARLNVAHVPEILTLTIITIEVGAAVGAGVGATVAIDEVELDVVAEDVETDTVVEAVDAPDVDVVEPAEVVEAPVVELAAVMIPAEVFEEVEAAVVEA